MSDDKDHFLDGEVGYGKPPKQTQFRKGVSGNPLGRPKGARGFATILRKVLQEKVVININGQRKTVSKLEAALMQMANKAASGDMLALRQVAPLALAADLEAAPEDKKQRSSEADSKVMARLLEKLKRSEKGGNNDGDN